MNRTAKMTRTANIIMEGQNYYQSNKRRVWVVGVAILFVLILFSISFISKTVTAQRNSDRQKYVTSIEVQKGDSLWKIASVYISDEYDDMNDYIREIKASNGMISDDLHAGNFIIVPYYADASTH